MDPILSTEPEDFRGVIDLWGKRADLAADIRVPRGTVQQWYHRNSVPPIWIPKVVAAARIRGFPVREDAMFRWADFIRSKGRAGNRPNAEAGA